VLRQPLSYLLANARGGLHACGGKGRAAEEGGKWSAPPEGDDGVALIRAAQAIVGALATQVDRVAEKRVADGAREVFGLVEGLVGRRGGR